MKNNPNDRKLGRQFERIPEVPKEPPHEKAPEVPSETQQRDETKPETPKYYDGIIENIEHFTNDRSRTSLSGGETKETVEYMKSMLQGREGKRETEDSNKRVTKKGSRKGKRARRANIPAPRPEDGLQRPIRPPEGSDRPLPPENNLGF